MRNKTIQRPRVIYIYGISHIIRSWDLVTESLYMLFRNDLWSDSVHPERIIVQTTIQQHHKSRQANNKIPVAHTHHVSFCLRHYIRATFLLSLALSPYCASSVLSSSFLSPFICLRKFFLVFKFPESNGSPFTIRVEREMEAGKRKKREIGCGEKRIDANAPGI